MSDKNDREELIDRHLRGERLTGGGHPGPGNYFGAGGERPSGEPIAGAGGG